MDNVVDILADKSVDNTVDNSMDKSVDNLSSLIALDESAWYVALAEHFAQLYINTSDSQKEYIKQLIISLGCALEAGHTCLSVGQFSLKFKQMQHPAIVDESNANAQPSPLVRAGDYVYFYRQWQQENQLAEHLVRIIQPVRAVTVQFAADERANELQRQAIQLAATYSFSLITGGPGTGKTFTLVRIVKALQQGQPDLRIALAAPTGKAAQRMQSVLDYEFEKSGIVSSHIQAAQTIHRLLGLGSGGKPRYHAHALLPFDLIVIDEGSMLDLALASLLFAAIATGTRVIILGDADQLAAVDAGAVLADLQQTQALKDYQINLMESRRFKSNEGIGQLADAILKQNSQQFWQAFKQSPQQLQHIDPQLLNDQQLFDQLWQGFLPYVEALQAGKSGAELFAAFDRYRILSAMRAGRLGIQRINQEMTKRLQLAQSQAKNQMNASNQSYFTAQQDWFNGRPVMMNRNDYALQLSNGDIGLCLADANGKWQIYFPHLKQKIASTRLPLPDISTAFALTIHKSQGSEFEKVSVMLDEAAKDLLSRELLYTAVTRAKNNVILWSNVETAEQALYNKALRDTGLKDQLQKMLKNDKSEHNVTFL